MNGLPSWSFAGMRRRRREEREWGREVGGGVIRSLEGVEEEGCVTHAAQ